MQKVIVTGGAGFIGSHLVDRLLNDGKKVIVIDNFDTGLRSNLTKHPNLKVVKADILGNIGRYFKGVNVVFHLAALTRPQWTIKHPVESNHVNVEGTLKVLMHCRDFKIKRVVFVSSSSLYGLQREIPTSEDCDAYPISPYALQKKIGEEYCQFFARMYDMKINCIRPFNVYGPRQSPYGGYAAAVPKFIDTLNKNKTPKITGNGKQSRDYIFVEDVVELMILASKLKVYGESFNAGSGKNISINKLYEIIAKLMGKKIKAIHVDPVIEPRLTLADISKARRLLSWEPKVSLEEGLKRTIEGTI